LLAAAMIVALAAAPSAAAGEKAFQRCISCHSVDPREKDLPGPNLAGVIGRRAATEPGFRYSPAMRLAGRGGMVWTEAVLDRYLADSAKALPGTEMDLPPLRNPAIRRAVIEYLKATRR
jgi:cytochrome c